MSQTVSPSAGRRYGLAVVCRLWEVARSTVYARLAREGAPHAPRRRRGPKTRWTDEQLLGKIRELLDASVFTGEGHRKIWARLRFTGVRTSKRRTLRLMREANLLAPTRTGHPHGPKAHDGTIVTERPDEMWGIDATSTFTRQDGSAAVFVLVDHCTAECLGLHAAKHGNRFEAMEPLRQAVPMVFGAYEADTATGLALRHDHGSPFVSNDFQAELDLLGITSSPAFVREPEGNGCAERFIRTLKEQLLWVQSFDTIEELRRALADFRERYNRAWLIERHSYVSPSQKREQFHGIRKAA